MSLGKDSIQKRVAKPAEAPAKKAPAKKSTVKAAVVTNIAPETLKKVVKGNAPAKKIGLGEELPYYLL